MEVTVGEMRGEWDPPIEVTDGGIPRSCAAAGTTSTAETSTTAAHFIASSYTWIDAAAPHLDSQHIANADSGICNDEQQSHCVPKFFVPALDDIGKDSGDEQ